MRSSSIKTYKDRLATKLRSIAASSRVVRERLSSRLRGRANNIRIRGLRIFSVLRGRELTDASKSVVGTWLRGVPNKNRTHWPPENETHRFLEALYRHITIGVWFGFITVLAQLTINIFFYSQYRTQTRILDRQANITASEHGNRLRDVLLQGALAESVPDGRSSLSKLCSRTVLRWPPPNPSAVDNVLLFGSSEPEKEFARRSLLNLLHDRSGTVAAGALEVLHRLGECIKGRGHKGCKRAMLENTTLQISLPNAWLWEAKLGYADLSDADLTEADLLAADLSCAVLDGATLFGAVLTGATLSGARLNGADLRQASLDDINWEGVDLRDALVSCADFRGYKNLMKEQYEKTNPALRQPFDELPKGPPKSCFETATSGWLGGIDDFWYDLIFFKNF